MYRIRQQITKKRLMILGGAIAVGLLIWGIVHWTVVSFRGAYENYAQYADPQEENAYVPGATDNPIRQQLNRVLTEILEGNITPARRLQDARDGLALINEVSVQIQIVGDRGGPVDQSIGGMESSLNPINSFATHGKVNEIITLAKKRADTIAEIRGFSSRADFETQAIFNQIINDKGELTPQYINNLNDKVPELEDQFNQRSNLYVDLGNTSQSIHDDAKALGWE